MEVFINTEEETFTESGEDYDMSFSDRETDALLMDKRTCFTWSVFRSVKDWNDAKDKLKICYVNYFVQYEACKRELLIKSEKNKDNYTCSDKNEENDSSEEGENDDMLTFERTIPGDAPTTKSRMSEAEKEVQML